GDLVAERGESVVRTGQVVGRALVAEAPARIDPERHRGHVGGRSFGGDLFRLLFEQGGLRGERQAQQDGQEGGPHREVAHRGVPWFGRASRRRETRSISSSGVYGRAATRPHTGAGQAGSPS